MDPIFRHSFLGTLTLWGETSILVTKPQLEQYHLYYLSFGFPLAIWQPATENNHSYICEPGKTSNKSYFPYGKWLLITKRPPILTSPKIKCVFKKKTSPTANWESISLPKLPRCHPLVIGFRMSPPMVSGWSKHAPNPIGFRIYIYIHIYVYVYIYICIHIRV